MGTQVVTEVAARHPEISDLVLISPVVDSTARTVRQSAFRFLRSTLHEPAAVRWHGITAYALCGWHWFRKVLPRMIAFPIEERAAHVQARTLIVRGEHDAMVPRDWVRRLARVFPYAVLREVVDGAHSVMHAQADAVARLAVAHVDHRTPRPRGVVAAARARRLDVVRPGAAQPGRRLAARQVALHRAVRHGDGTTTRRSRRPSPRTRVAMADGDDLPVDPADRQAVVDAVAPEPNRTRQHRRQRARDLRRRPPGGPVPVPRTGTGPPGRRGHRDVRRALRP